MNRLCLAAALLAACTSTLTGPQVTKLADPRDVTLCRVIVMPTPPTPRIRDIAARVVAQLEQHGIEVRPWTGEDTMRGPKTHGVLTVTAGDNLITLRLFSKPPPKSLRSLRLSMTLAQFGQLGPLMWVDSQGESPSTDTDAAMIDEFVTQGVAALAGSGFLKIKPLPDPS